MADSTVIDYSKMKVTELRKELKARGHSSAGDKSDLIARLRSVAAAETEYALDSDEIDSDSVLEDDDDKNPADTSLDDSHLNDELVDLEPAKPSQEESKPKTVTPKTLKRKLIVPPVTEKIETKTDDDKKETTAKKIVLHRPSSVPAVELKPDKPTAPATLESVSKATPEVIKAVTTPGDPKAKLELRAKRFGLPMTDAERKEARKIRFGQTASSGISATPTATASPGAKVIPLDSNVEKLKKRAERFGQSVSKAMADVEATERLEKRRAKFGLVK